MWEFGDATFVCQRRQRVLMCARHLIIAALLLTNPTHANWWYLGLSSSAIQSTESGPKSHYRETCSELEVLSEHQKEICARARNILPVVSRGASMAIEECQYQFLKRRWNCTTFEQKTVFGNILVRNSREKAYIYAISSAGVTHSITKACSKGEVQMCSCDLNVRSQRKEVDFLWGGCSHDVRFGEKFSKEFVDGRESSSDQNLEEQLMNRWNNEAGRKAVSGNMKLLCKCHGVSGSCSAKICWRTVASFREIGDLLKDRFDGATRVKVIAAKVKLKPVDRRQKRPTRRDLVYLDQSPDYCDYRPEVGSLGTVGRQCNRTSYGLDGCQLMCCGRGYRTYVEEEVEDCNCKFFWCCSVECQKCTSSVEKYYCN